MTVYVLERDNAAGSLNRLAAVLGFSQLGEEVIEFTADGFDDLPVTLDDIVIGGVGYCRRAFARMRLDVPHLLPIPPELEPFAGRKLWRQALSEVRNRVQSGETLFTKPAPDQPKLFNGMVLSSFRDLIATAHLDGALVVDCAEPVEFLSEFRTFVLHGEVLDMRPYRGDPLLAPDADTVRAAISAYATSPASYSLDVGVATDGRTLLVEINDAYALGAYGLFPIAYARFIAARWDELRRRG